MKSIKFSFWTAAGAALLYSPVLWSQQVERDVSVVSQEVASQLEGYSYREGPESDLEFRGTAIALAAYGKGEVEFQDGRSRVDVTMQKLPQPKTLGPYTTYVLWAVTVDGRANNLGSLDLRSSGKGTLDTSTPLSQFALIVSAEPHFAVTAPSKAVVMRNLGKNIKGEKVMIAGLTERMDYDSLSRQQTKPRSREPMDLIQARYAMAIAEAAHASDYSSTEYSQATKLLADAETAAASKKYRDRKTAPRIAREATQMAEDARRQAVRSKTSADAAAHSEAAALAARAEADVKAQREAATALEMSRQLQSEAAGKAELAATRKARADLTARLNRVLPTRETDRGIVAEIAGVQFATGAAALNNGARESLARFAGIVGVYPTMKFDVEGHTDSTGSDETNRTLSLQRALVVRDYLIAQSVAASHIDVAGLGSAQPVAANTDAEGRARNRRVEIILTGGLLNNP